MLHVASVAHEKKVVDPVMVLIAVGHVVYIVCYLSSFPLTRADFLRPCFKSFCGLAKGKRTVPIHIIVTCNLTLEGTSQFRWRASFGRWLRNFGGVLG